jgi:hypothetical protein
MKLIEVEISYYADVSIPDEIFNRAKTEGKNVILDYIGDKGLWPKEYECPSSVKIFRNTKEKRREIK